MCCFIFLTALFKFMKIKINSNFYIVIYFILMIFMNQSIGLSYINLVSFLFLAVSAKTIKLHKCIQTKIYYIYIAYAIVVTMLNLWNGNISYYRININLIGLLIMCFTTTMVLAEHSDIDLFCVKIRDFSWVFLGCGILEYITKFNITRFMRNSNYVETYLDGEGRIMSIFYHPLGYATFLIFLFMIIQYYPYNEHRKQIAFNVLLVINLLLTKSRSSLMILVFIWIIRKFKYLNTLNLSISKKKIRELVFIIALIFIVIFAFKNKINVVVHSVIRRFLNMGVENKEGIRAVIILNFINYLRSSPISCILFGNGIGYSYRFMEINPVTYFIDGKLNLWTQTTDNTYISMILDFGIIGLIIFIILIVATVKTFFSCKNMKKEMASLILISIFIQLFIMEGLYWPTIMFIFAFSFGVMNKMNNDNRTILVEDNQRG